MQFRARDRQAIDAGTLTVTFRRWRRSQVVAGRRYRTAAGMIEVESVSVVDPASISDADARRAGHPDAAALVLGLRGDPDLDVYRVEFHRAPGPDPRAVLAGTAELTPDEIDTITARLARLDRAAPGGPWTGAALQAIADAPGVQSGVLAAGLGRERAPFKLDVRKLKALGLTESLPVGYRLSPRGEAYLRAVTR
jgi:hypothetical protein